MFLFAPPALGQSIVDGSGIDIDPDVVERLLTKGPEDFRDPSSTQFRKVSSSSRKGFICGEVNGRNGFGAYVGFRPFAWNTAAGSMTVLRTGSDIPEMDKLYALVLRQSGCPDGA